MPSNILLEFVEGSVIISLITIIVLFYTTIEWSDIFLLICYTSKLLSISFKHVRKIVWKYISRIYTVKNASVQPVDDVKVPQLVETVEALAADDRNTENLEFRFLQEDTVNPTLVVLEKQKCLITNAKKTAYNRIAAQKYNGVVKHFFGDDTESTIEELNRNRKYWVKRFQLFEQFDAGIILDDESFYSVCPEMLAKHIAERYCRFPDGVAVDPFCGAGGNAIQLARTCRKVIAMDIDAKKLKLARHNAGVYGVGEKIEFRCKDFFAAAPSGQQVDVVVTSPPWGGPEYLRRDSYSPSVLCETYGGGEAVVLIARTMAPRLALHLPRTVNKSECVAIAKKFCCKRLKFEHNIINGRHNSTTVFFSF